MLNASHHLWFAVAEAVKIENDAPNSFQRLINSSLAHRLLILQISQKSIYTFSNYSANKWTEVKHYFCWAVMAVIKNKKITSVNIPYQLEQDTWTRQQKELFEEIFTSGSDRRCQCGQQWSDNAAYFAAAAESGMLAMLTVEWFHWSCLTTHWHRYSLTLHSLLAAALAAADVADLYKTQNTPAQSVISTCN